MIALGGDGREPHEPHPAGLPFGRPISWQRSPERACGCRSPIRRRDRPAMRPHSRQSSPGWMSNDAAGGASGSHATYTTPCTSDARCRAFPDRRRRSSLRPEIARPCRRAPPASRAPAPKGKSSSPAQARQAGDAKPIGPPDHQPHPQRGRPAAATSRRRFRSPLRALGAGDLHRLHRQGQRRFRTGAVLQSTPGYQSLPVPTRWRFPPPTSSRHPRGHVPKRLPRRERRSPAVRVQLAARSLSGSKFLSYGAWWGPDRSTNMCHSRATISPSITPSAREGRGPGHPHPVRRCPRSAGDPRAAAGA